MLERLRSRNSVKFKNCFDDVDSFHGRNGTRMTEQASSAATTHVRGRAFAELKYVPNSMDTQRYVLDGG
jgi:hypothetical protein